MNDPIDFNGMTPRLGLPLLFAAQAQKEVFVNEAHAVLDALVHGIIEAESDTPPLDPQDGQCWIVGSGATGDWVGRETRIACRQSGQWLYVTPVDGMRVLDHCAGGGGKTLAMAARAHLSLFAHDASPARMRDLPVRASRAGAKVTVTDHPEKQAPFDLVLADAPCSGSGSWRRDPQGKWALTPERLAQIGAVQDQILDRMAPMVRRGGTLAYATCSLLRAENEDRIAAFLDRQQGWRLLQSQRYTPLSGGDGFFLALLTQSPS